MGQLESTCRAPPRRSGTSKSHFESKGCLKPVSHLIGARVETTWVPGAFQLWVRGSQRAPGPPPRRLLAQRDGDAALLHRQIAVLGHGVRLHAPYRLASIGVFDHTPYEG
jgi:hypothetical protein